MNYLEKIKYNRKKRFMKKCIVKDINNGKCKLSNRSIDIKMDNGLIVSAEVEPSVLIEYICMSQRELEEKVPRNLNSDFYKDYKGIREYYRTKVESIKANRINNIKWIAGTGIGVATLLVTI